MSKLARWTVLVAVLGTLLLTGWMLTRSGLYGFSLFLFVPMVTGGAAAIIFKAESAGHAAAIGTAAATAGCFLFVLFAWEGLICIVMAMPLILLLGGAGGAIAFRIFRSKARAAALALVMLPTGGGSLAIDTFATPAVRPVMTEIEIAAPPQEVWRHVIAFPDIPEPKEWYFRIGIAYPKRARVDRQNRYCDFTTGPVVETILTEDAPHWLVFSVDENPAPMRELTFYDHVEPKHLHGYFESERGEFRLIPINGGRATRIQGTSWYRHGLWPDAYWRIWSDAIVHRIHLRVMGHIKELAEQNARASLP